MQYTEANLGRIFVIKLEQGDKIPDTLENFAKSQQIESAMVYFLGGAEQGSKVVVGPVDGSINNPRTIITELSGTSEGLGLGTIFKNQIGEPKLHLHAAFGRERDTITGCTREGVAIWYVGEVVMLELTNLSAQRKIDPESGFEILSLAK